jgi:hypothetical protein
LTIVRLIALASAAALASGGAVGNPRTPPRSSYSMTPDAPMEVWLPRLAGSYRFEGAVEVVYDHPDFVGHGCGWLPTDPAESESLPSALLVPYCSSVKGAGDCVAIGNGPGLQCILDVSWDNFGLLPGGDVLAGGVSYLGPAMQLFGVDPGKLAISHLLVDSKGLSEGGAGVIKGNKAIFKTPCVDSPSILADMPPLTDAGRRPQPPYYHTAWLTCDRTVRIDAAPDAKVLHMSIDIHLNSELFTRIEMTMRRKSLPDPAAPGKR